MSDASLDHLSAEDRRIWEAEVQRQAYGGEPRWVLIGDPPMLTTVLTPPGHTP